MYDERIRARFMAKVEVQPDGCWRWSAALTRTGYGKWAIERKARIAHRVAYEIFIGPIPDGLVIDHLCRNRACVNPEHLEAVTIGENVRRGKSGRAGEGMRTHCRRGHEYTADNILVESNSRGGTLRACRRCRALKNRQPRNRTAPRPARSKRAGQD